MERPRELRIVVADDNHDTRELYAFYLTTVGYKVETAADGREAVRVARAFQPDLIVMDLQMPNVDGWAAIRELQRDEAMLRVPLIALTGHEFKHYLKASALAAGAWSFLTKPCLPERLANEIAARLRDRVPIARIARTP